MSNRETAGWLIAAYFGAIIWAHFVANVFVAGDLDSEEQACHRQEQQRQAQKRVAAGQSTIPPTSEQSAADDKAAREYCIQRRAAKAGERQADLSRYGLYVGIGAIVAAIGAAVGAFLTVGTMRSTAQLENRAWLQIEEAKAINGFKIDADGFHLTASVAVKNVGKTPAKNVLVRCKMVGVGGSIQTLPEDIAALRADSKVKYRSQGRATIFPDEVLPAAEEAVSIDRARITAVAAVLPTLDNVVVPLVLIAVTYGGVDGGGPYETGRIYFVDDIDIGKHHGQRDWSPSLKRTRVSDEWTA